MEFLAMLYTVLLVAICLMLALLLYRGNKPRRGGGDTEELKQWLTQQLEAQAKSFEQKQAAMAEQNYTAIRSVSETLQTAVQNMSSTLAQGQSGQQQILTQRLQSLEAANTQKLEELRKTLADSMTALQAENTRKLDEIRHTVDEQLQDALQKRVSESFKAVNEQLEQVYKGLGEMQSLAADVGGLKQVLSGVKTRGILGEIQLGAILEEILAPEQYDTNVATIPGSTQRVEYAIKMPGVDGSTVPQKIIGRILSFFFLYFIAFFTAVLVISLSGVSELESMNIAAGCLTSTGQLALLDGSPMTILGLSNAAKLFCCFLMILGKLEIFSFLIVLQAGYLRLQHSRW